MELTFSEDLRLQQRIRSAGELLKSTSVEIGLPANASPRNRWLLALHEHGAPGAHIPPRPVVAPALGSAETQAAIRQGLLDACEAAVAGDEPGVLAGITSAGQAVVEGIHAYIDAGISPGNAPLTIHGGWIRNCSSGRPVHEEGKGFDKPLYDTGELYRSFSFEVK